MRSCPVPKRRKRPVLSLTASTSATVAHARERLFRFRSLHPSCPTHRHVTQPHGTRLQKNNTLHVVKTPKTFALHAVHIADLVGLGTEDR
jgi:hypothetical protein